MPNTVPIITQTTWEGITKIQIHIDRIRYEQILNKNKNKIDQEIKTKIWKCVNNLQNDIDSLRSLVNDIEEKNQVQVISNQHVNPERVTNQRISPEKAADILGVLRNSPTVEDQDQDQYSVARNYPPVIEPEPIKKLKRNYRGIFKKLLKSKKIVPNDTFELSYKKYLTQ